jgi:hypothetical protein
MQVAEILEHLILGSSVAEFDDRLDSYFVNTHTFNELLSGRKDIVAGDKGTGKTALYRILMKRHDAIREANGVRIVPAFNVSGSPVFQQLLSIPVQTEGQYIAFWKTYFLSLIGNWMLDQIELFSVANRNRVENLLAKYGLKTIDTTPAGVFQKIMAMFHKLSPHSIQAEIGLNESAMPHVTPRIEFDRADAVQPPDFFGVDYWTGLKLLETSLKNSGVSTWVALDRLDEAFPGYPAIEIPALRALLRTYLDMQAFSNIKVKLFLRKDLFRRILSGNFVNLTHINNRKIEIVWDEDDLKNLLIARIKDSTQIVSYLSLPELDNDGAFGKVFPDKISQGKKQSTTWNWIISRIRDGNGVIAPRNLIELVEKARESQLRCEARSPREYRDTIALIEPESVRRAHRALSLTRVQDTLLAEAADLAPLIERFRDKKAEQNLASLSVLLAVPEQDVRVKVKPLVEIGFLEESGTTFKVPMLYREGMSITQGKAWNSSAAEADR